MLSKLAGLCLVGIFLLISLHAYNHKGVHDYSPNYYHHDHHAGEELNNPMYVVNAGRKKLQQSSNYLPEDEGVKFLPLRR